MRSGDEGSRRAQWGVARPYVGNIFLRVSERERESRRG